MPVLQKLRIERSYGPTVLSLRPVIRFDGEVGELERALENWPAAREALARSLAAIGVDDRPGSPWPGGDGRELVAALAGLEPPAGVGKLPAAVGRLLAATAASLLAAARAPQLAWGGVPSRSPRFMAYWDDWMQGAGLAAAPFLGNVVEAAFAGDQAELEERLRGAVEAIRAARVDGFVYPMARLAEERGIAWRPLSSTDYLYAYGEGARQRWIRSTLGEDQSVASVSATLHKDQTSKLLARAGFPVPAYRLVSSRKAAMDAARALGYPLVVKPVDASRAENVALWLEDPEAVGAAYAACGADGTNVMVERQIEGEPYRILVCGGRAISAGRHKVPFLTGDGVSTVDQLIAAHDARAALPVQDGYRRFYPFDREYYAAQMSRRLEAQGLTADSVPAAGREVLLGYIPQRNRGGLYLDLTDRIHPDLMRMAEGVAEVIGSPTLGLDVITTDLTQPLGSVPLAINEVNSAPIPYSHEQVEHPRIVAREALAHSFPEGDQGRIPVACFLGVGAREILGRLEGFLSAAGRVPGIADPETARIEGFALRPGDGARGHPGLAVLRDRRPEVAAFAYELRDLCQRGAASNHAEVAAFLPGVLTSEAPLLRPAAHCLVGLPGGLLLTPAGENCDWLHEAAPHRRWIAVSGRGSDTKVLAQAQAVGAATVAAEGNSVLLTEDGRRDRLYRGTMPPPADLVWALAALLGLGFAPGEVLRLAGSVEPALAAPV